MGVVTTLEVNHKQVENARKGTEVCIKIESVSGDAPRLYGRHFDHTDLLVSKVSRGEGEGGDELTFILEGEGGDELTFILEGEEMSSRLYWRGRR